ncbi:MAG: MmgE/PrpD family protein, partial [Kiloniellales bacterium]|nr:MmgE/PrpD family protein [Kiloniellales bacterium]
PETAALLNGTAAHALDFDDTCFAGIVHGSAAILPALLAAAETEAADGRTLLTAFVAGSEVAYSLGAALGPGLYDRGWWPTGCLAGIGAAAAVARLQGAGPQAMTHAIALAAAQSGGTRSLHGSDAKAVLVGRAAEAGLRSANLARQGVTGPERVFEGANGLFALMGAGDVDLHAIDRMGEPFKLRDPGLVVKPYPVCSCAMQAVEALCRLMEEHDVAPGQIARIEGAVTPMVAATLRFDRPATPIEALFSLPFTLALAASRGGIGPFDISETTLSDPGIHALMDKVDYREDPSIADIAAFPEAARVDLVTTDGSTFSHQCNCATGDPRAPMSDEDLRAKVLACADPVLGEESAGRLHALARRADDLPDLTELMDLARG